MFTSEALAAQKAARRTEVDKDWAKCTDELVNRVLEASRRVPNAGFEEFAAEFTLGPNASAERKLELTNTLAALKRTPARSYFKQLKAVMDAARNSFPLIPTEP